MHVAKLVQVSNGSYKSRDVTLENNVETETETLSVVECLSGIFLPEGILEEWDTRIKFRKT